MHSFVDLTPLPHRRALFVLEYLKDLNATQAAVRAGYSAKWAEQEGHRLLHDPDVAAHIEQEIAARASEIRIDGADVVRAWFEIATADPNELIASLRGACRYCWGEGFGYQRTQGEMARDRAQHERDEDRRRKDEGADYDARAFNEAGGIGYDPRKPAHEDCPECFGRGVLDVHVSDTRLLRGPARRLYAGVKQTKDGIEIKMHDQDKAREMLARHLGLLKDKLEVTGKLTLEQLIAASMAPASDGAG